MIDKEKFDKIYKPDYNIIKSNFRDIKLEDYKYLVEELSISRKILVEFYNITNGQIEALRQKFKKQGLNVDKVKTTKLSNLYYYGVESTNNTDSYHTKMKEFWKNISDEDKNKIIKKRCNSVKEKYGVDYFSQCELGKDKIKNYHKHKSKL